MKTFTETKIVLMYPEKPTESYYDNSYMFVDLDGPSGGYPTRAVASNAYDFADTSAAMKYKASFPKENFIIVRMQTTHTITPL